MVVNGERIKKLIEDTGLNQNDVARLIGKSNACVCNVIRDGRASRSTVEGLCMVLRVTPDVITSIPDESPKEDSPTVMASIHMLHRKMSDLEKKMDDILGSVAELKSIWE